MRAMPTKPDFKNVARLPNGMVAASRRGYSKSC
jgi:hypothetical protein